MKLGIRNVRKTFRILKCDFYNRLHSLKFPAIYEDVCGDCHFSVQLWAKMTIFFSFFFFLCREYQRDYNYVYRWKTKDERSARRGVYRTRIRTSSFVIWIVVTFIGDFNPRPLNFHFWTKHVGETLWSNYRVKFISQVSGFTL